MIKNRLQSKLGNLVLALIISLGAVGVSATVAPAPSATAAGTTTAVCWKPNPAIKGSSTTNWTGKNPKDCKARYQLYDISRGRAVLVLDINSKATSSAAFWSAVKSGYNAAQKWCGQNSLTCNIIVSVGIILVSPLAAAARG